MVRSRNRTTASNQAESTKYERITKGACIVCASRRLAGVIVVLLFSESVVPAATFNVRDFGARGDKKTNDSRFIQAAIDECHRKGGGIVSLPPGDYLSGMIRLRSHVTFRLENGATLWASPREEDYVRSAHVGRGVKVIYYLLVAEDQEHIALEGDGVIHGTGRRDLLRRVGTSDTMPPFQIGTLFLQRCRRVSVRDLSFRYSACWTLHFLRCEEVFVNAVSIVNNYFRTVTDGIDVVSCRDVHIANCHISTGDDSICLKSRDGYPCRHVVVSNCTLESIATAIKLGTESESDFHDIRFSNCTIRNSTVGVGVYVKDGANVQRVSFADLSIGTVEDPSQIREYSRRAIYPMFVDIEQRDEDSPIGTIRDMTFRNIQIHSDNGILIQGMKKSPLENITLQNVTMRVERGFDYSERTKHGGGTANPDDDRRTLYARKPSYLTLAHVDGLHVDNIRLFVKDEVFTERPRSALSIYEAEAGTIRSIWRRPGGKEGGQPVISLRNCRHMFITDCCPLPGTPTFLGMTGPRTARVSLTGNDLNAAKQAVVQSHDVPADAAK